MVFFTQNAAARAILIEVYDNFMEHLYWAPILCGIGVHRVYVVHMCTFQFETKYVIKSQHHKHQCEIVKLNRVIDQIN